MPGRVLLRVRVGAPVALAGLRPLLYLPARAHEPGVALAEERRVHRVVPELEQELDAELEVA